MSSNEHVPVLLGPVLEETSGPSDKCGKKGEWNTPIVAKAKPKGKGARLVQFDYSGSGPSFSEKLVNGT